ncbi:hypothetical protein [Micromonospora endolithica]|uniref:Uncharacterized protein n=1 Tax=Micromonospora endolithica TaxID=230091 RepID=A0A3A9Z7W0_9ACTN|nr:hypothetical protein [Micromonospora endolithica]RKN44370.1 hypothetical protein D7223_19105 [Micromonospora endolithica]TWJ25856.1 hypothetical protein JD76_06033 [Micromonospora endolithica]
MVYRYESDEDAFLEYPDPASGPPSGLGAAERPAAGPSPSRFPVPSLPRTNRLALPSMDPTPAPGTHPRQPPRAAVYATTGTAPSRATRGGRGGGGRMWQVVVGGAAVLVLLALCGLGAAALVNERNADPRTTPTEEPAAARPTAPAQQNLDARGTDPVPLTAREVFGGRRLVPGDGQATYQVLKTHSSGSCAVAATGEVAELLVRLGCSQVVRATLRTPDGQHLVTTGLFNLVDRASAEDARDRIRQVLDDREGRFRGMVADEETEAIGTAPARVGWQVRGHYLAYALVARVDSEAIRSGDPTAREILFDMIELHLNQGVLERRATGGTAAQPTEEATGSQEGGSAGD